MWQMISSRIETEDGETANTYGIQFGTTVINDISPNKQEIQEFVMLLNRLGASELHAYDLVENFLGR